MREALGIKKKSISLSCSHADLMGGSRHIFERRLLTSCLLCSKLRNFRTRQGDRATVDVCVGCIVMFHVLFVHENCYIHIGVGFNVAYPCTWAMRRPETGDK